MVASEELQELPTVDWGKYQQDEEYHFYAVHRELRTEAWMVYPTHQPFTGRRMARLSCFTCTLTTQFPLPIHIATAGATV